MMQQLYIDGTLADIKGDTDMTLTVTSNVLQGAADFTGNRSLTITLPSTVRNRTIIGNADKVASGSTAPYLFHTIDFYRNGAQVISGGKGRVIKADTESIDIAVTWGVRVAVESLLTADDTLNDITTTAAITFNSSPVVSQYSDALTDEVFYAALDTVKRTGIKNFQMRVGLASRSWDTSSLEGASSNLHPSVRMDWILGKLQTKYGITFDWGTAAADIAQLIVPLISKVPNDETYNGGYRGSMSEPSSWGGSGGNYVRFKTDTGHTSPIIATNLTPSNILTCTTAFNGTFRFSAYLYLDASDLRHMGGPIYLPKYGYEIIFAVNGTPVQSCVLLDQNATIMEDEIVSGTRVNMTATAALPIDMDVNDTLTMRIGCIDAGAYDPTLGDGIHVQGGSFWVSDIDGDEVQPGQVYPVQGNLPEIKPIELIKFLCAITGTFPVQASTSSTLTMKPVSGLFDWSNAVDWSGRLLSPTSRPVADTTEYNLDGWAKMNMWRWKHDDTVEGDYDGGIEVDNATLEESRDIMTFPFAATDGNNIPMYTYENKWNGDNNAWDTDIKWGKCEPRVLKLEQGSASKAVARFDMDMTTIIANKYAYLVTTMRHPVIISERVRLSYVEFAAVDESRPVYLAQHGAYFALLELTHHSDGTADVKLLRLKKEI